MGSTINIDFCTSCSYRFLCYFLDDIFLISSIIEFENVLFKWYFFGVEMDASCFFYVNLIL